ncbi:MAG TPA: T9SS type A sorting domain-containing protein, partial [Bacteroidia bacterium]|nr:T9SS type A sorting domain-containing protein [Bacteroidia bacterium]
YISAYLVKYDSSGNVLWAVNSKGPTSPYSSCLVMSLAVDNAGNTFITGDIEDSVFFGPYILIDTNYPARCPFITKYDKNGNILWAKEAPCTDGRITSVVTDLSGNALTTGVFSDSIVFGSTILRVNPSVNNGWGMFTAKYDPSGNVLWVKQAQGQVSDDFSEISTDNLGNAYVTGSFFYDSATFGSFTLRTAFLDMFLVKYDPLGNVIWAKQSYAIGGNGKAGGCAIARTRFNDFYVTGQFEGSVLIGSDTIIALIPNQNDIFIAKYDSGGNVIWVKSGTVLDSNSWLPFSISADTVNRFYLTCCTYDAEYTGHTTCKIKIGTDTFLLNVNPKYDGASVLAEFDSSGRILCGDIIKLGEADGGQWLLNNLATDASGKYVYLGGTAAEDTLVFGAYTVLPWYSYIAKWQPCDGGTEQGVTNISASDQTAILFPNPNKGVFTIQTIGVNNESLVEVYNIFGEMIYTAKLNTTTTQLDLSNNAAGVYLYRVITETGDLISDGRFVIQK